MTSQATPRTVPKNRPSYVSGVAERPLKGETIGDCFDATVARYPDRDALISRHQGLRYSWTRLQAEVDRAARALLAVGVASGERVGIWATNRAEWAITQFATAKIGAILVNINPSYRSHELDYALRQSGTSTLILQGAFKTSRYADMIAELVPALNETAGATLAGATRARSFR